LVRSEVKVPTLAPKTREKWGTRPALSKKS
jgi:hypothetical protein